ncbi:hypothetical protein ACFQVC_15320 [Streptomyces monticola]|uniref:Secreted protein n=1 Tax=Streptomyces monticola TaxID=2666263 RepID=A0ABW2JJT5_9ACTN
MEAVIAAVALLVVLFMVLGVFVTIKIVKTAARGVDRTIEQTRRTVEDTTLKARTFAQPGAAGELAQLRLKLRTTMRATQEALGAGAVHDASLQESLRLFERLSAHGLELDAELKRLERDPDKVRLAQRLPEIKERTEQITTAADSLRWAAHDRARNFADDDLSELGRQIDVESGALRHWMTEEPGGQGAESRAAQTPATPGATGPTAPSWPEPTLVDGPRVPPEQTWPDPKADEKPGEKGDRKSGEEAGPQAIEQGRPVTYPWQKSAKPESTT